MKQAEADTELTLSALPAMAVGQNVLRVNSVNHGEILLEYGRNKIGKHLSNFDLISSSEC